MNIKPHLFAQCTLWSSLSVALPVLAVLYKRRNDVIIVFYHFQLNRRVCMETNVYSGRSVWGSHPPASWSTSTAKPCSFGNSGLRYQTTTWNQESWAVKLYVQYLLHCFIIRYHFYAVFIYLSSYMKHFDKLLAGMRSNFILKLACVHFPIF